MNQRQKLLFLALFIWQAICVKWSVNGQTAAYSSSPPHFYLEHTHTHTVRCEGHSKGLVGLSLCCPLEPLGFILALTPDLHVVFLNCRLPPLVCPPVFCTLTPSLQLQPIPLCPAFLAPSSTVLLFVPLLLSSPSLPVVPRPLSLTLPDSSFKRRNRAPAWATAMQSNKPCLKPNYCWDVFIYIPSLHLPFLLPPYLPIHPCIVCMNALSVRG